MWGRLGLAPLLLASWPLAALAEPPLTALPSASVTRPSLRAKEADRLYDLMQLPQLVATMRVEGLRMTEELALDYLAPPAVPAFEAMARTIYDPARMDRVMRAAFVRRLREAEAWELEHLLAFYDSAAAQRIVAAELAARRDFLDEGAEQAAGRAAEVARVEDPALVAIIDSYVAAGDLVELNLGGMLNANYSFYLGLVAGGAFDMSEEEMLADIWQQEDGARLTIEIWLRAFLTHAYRDLPEATLADYLTVMQSSEGQRLISALFEASGVLYNDLYHALGLSVSTLLSGEDL